MPDQAIHERRPFLVMFGRRHVRLPPETTYVRLAGDVFRKETELDKRAHAVGEQSVDDVIDVLPVENQGSIVPATDEHVVVQQSMEAQVAEPAMLRYQLQM